MVEASWFCFKGLLIYLDWLTLVTLESSAKPIITWTSLTLILAYQKLILHAFKLLIGNK